MCMRSDFPSSPTRSPKQGLPSQTQTSYECIHVVCKTIQNGIYAIISRKGQQVNVYSHTKNVSPYLQYVWSNRRGSYWRQEIGNEGICKSRWEIPRNVLILKEMVPLFQIPLFSLFLRAISVLLGDKWKKLGAEERRLYVLEAKLLADKQKQLHPDCWKRKRSMSTGGILIKILFSVLRLGLFSIGLTPFYFGNW